MTRNTEITVKNKGYVTKYKVIISAPMNLELLKKYVDDSFNEIEIPTLEGYATEEYVIQKVNSIDLSDYVLKKELDSYATLNNIAELPSKDYVDNKVDSIDLSGFIPITIYSNEGILDSLKCWTGEVISNEDGIFTVDWSSAGFSKPPFHVSTAAYKTTDKETGRVFCSMSEDYDKDRGTGYTTKGSVSVAVDVGGGKGTELAPNVKVTVMAWGI